MPSLPTLCTPYTTPMIVARDGGGGPCGLCKEPVSFLYSSELFSSSSIMATGEDEGKWGWIQGVEDDSFCSECVGMVNQVFIHQKKIEELNHEVDRILELIKTRTKGNNSKKVEEGLEENFKTEPVEEDWLDNSDALSDASFVLFPEAEIELCQDGIYDEMDMDHSKILEGDHDEIEDFANHTLHGDEGSSCTKANDQKETSPHIKKTRKSLNKGPRWKPKGRGKTPYFCGSCEQSFSLITKYLLHLKETEHNQGTSVDESNLKPQILNRLVIPFVNGPPWICPESSCSKSFVKRPNYSRHYRLHHLHKHCKFNCDLCNKKFYYNVHYKNHTDTLDHRIAIMKKEGLKDLPPRTKNFIRVHHKTEDVEGICEFCGKCLKSRENLTKHVAKCGSKNVPSIPSVSSQLVENGDNPSNSSSSPLFRCEECGKTFRKLSNLNVHMRDNHILKPLGNKEPVNKLSCKHCGKNFNCWGNMRKHEQTVHTAPEERRHCQQCNETFETIIAKMLHDRSIHEGKGILTCPYCGKLFPSSAIMKTHMTTTHAVPAQIPCPKCGKCYKTKSSMKIHLRTKCEPDLKWVKHLREYTKRKGKEYRETKPWKCDKCGKGISDPRVRSRHKERCTEGQNVAVPSEAKLE